MAKSHSKTKSMRKSNYKYLLKIIDYNTRKMKRKIDSLYLRKNNCNNRNVDTHLTKLHN